MSITINEIDSRTMTLKAKEGKTLTITYECSIVDATFDLIVKDSAGTTKITKANASFDVSNKANKIVTVILTTVDLNLTPGKYQMELKTTWDSVNSVDKTETIDLIIQSSLHA
jgi:hypothetical protein